MDELIVFLIVIVLVFDGFCLLVLEFFIEINLNENKNLRLDWFEKKINKVFLKKCMYRFLYFVKRFNK